MAGARGKAPDATASIAGAGGGTGLLGLANLIPEQYPVARSILIYISPAVTIGIAVAWIYITSYLRKKVRRWQMNGALDEARQIRDAVFANPTSSEAHKKRAQESVEKLEHLAMEIINDETESVRATLREIK